MSPLLRLFAEYIAEALETAPVEEAEGDEGGQGDRTGLDAVQEAMDRRG